MAESYTVRIVPSARRDLVQLPDPPRQRLRLAIRRLAKEPRPPSAKLLSGRGAARFWRIRVGDYRVLYEIRDTELVVLVIRVGHRHSVYRGRSRGG